MDIFSTIAEADAELEHCYLTLAGLKAAIEAREDELAQLEEEAEEECEAVFGIYAWAGLTSEEH